VGKLNTLVKNAEDPYWATEDVIRYPTASPVVSSANYHLHDWAPDFRSVQTEAKSEVEKQLETEAADCETKQKNCIKFPISDRGNIQLGLFHAREV